MSNYVLPILLFYYLNVSFNSGLINDPKFSDKKVWQTMQTQIRLLLEEQSGQGLHCLLFHLHHLDKYP